MYVVIRSSGSYDDYNSEPIAISSSKEVADAFAAARNAEIPKLVKVQKKYSNTWDKRHQTIMSKMTMPVPMPPSRAGKYSPGKVSKEEQSKRDKASKEFQDQTTAWNEEYYGLLSLYDEQFYKDNGITEEDIEYFHAADNDTEYHVQEIKSLD